MDSALGRRLTIALLLFECVTLARADTPIVVDGRFEDWSGREPIASDVSGDAAPATPDFGRLWVAHDGTRLLARVEVGIQLLLQEADGLRLYLDTDDDPTTGLSHRGLGADVVWDFGTRSGELHAGAGPTVIRHPELGLSAAPTVTSTEFEIALDLTSSALQPRTGPAVRLLFEQRDGDLLPDAAGGARYSLEGPVSPAIQPTDLARQPGALRVGVHNVLRDGLFDPSREEHFARLLSALDADVLAFQEVSEHGAEETRARLEILVPGTPFETAKAGRDLVVASRYPILDSRAIAGLEDGGRAAAFLIDLRPDIATDLLLIVAHLKCCRGGVPDADVQRQRHADEIMAFVRDAKRGAAEPGIVHGTPIVIAGDMNLVGEARQLHTLLSGEIADAERLGPGEAPDWDGSPLLDLGPRHSHAPLTHTWADDVSSFYPGRLDVTLTSDSVLAVVKSFVLDTAALPPEVAVAFGLQSRDSALASDHLVLVTDLVPR